jgi:hypothetical protein
MTPEEHKQVIDLYLDHIKEYMTESGGLFPHITVFADEKNKKVEEDGKVHKAIIHIPIPSEYMKSDSEKDVFIEEVMPVIFKTLVEKFIPYGIAWASEAWMRVADADKFDPKKDNYKNIPIKKEVLFISIETDAISETIIYDIERTGKQVCADGDLVDTINLKEIEEFRTPDKVEGRFAGLYKKLKDYVKVD